MRYDWRTFNCICYSKQPGTQCLSSQVQVGFCGDVETVFQNNISSRGKPNRWSITHLINRNGLKIYTQHFFLILHFSSYVLQIYVSGLQKHVHKCCHFVPSSLYQWHYTGGWQLWANPFRSLLVNSEPPRLLPEQLRLEAKEQSRFCKCCW